MTQLHERAATTLGLVIVDAPSDRRTLERCGVAAHDGYARAIRPCHTIFDGDIVFAASMRSGSPEPREIARIALAAELAIERAIMAAVRAT
jgi:D-aminopeptidase